MEEKKLSVIVPVYNGERWLKQCIQSLQEQTIFAQLEVIIVNDGSTDSSPQIIDEWAAENRNVLVVHSDNQGVSSARNKGLDIAQGQYVTFFDVDDKLDNDYYETMLRYADESCDIVCGGYVVKYPERNIICKASSIQYYDNAEGIEQYLRSKEIDPNVWDKVFRNDLVKNIRFNKNFIVGEDKYFVFQCISRSQKIKVIPEAKYHYMMNEASVTHSSFSKKKLDSCLIIAGYILEEAKKNYPQFSELAECYAIDSKVRLIGELYRTKAYKKYQEEYRELCRQVRKFSLRKKSKYSSKKHLAAFLTMKIHPSVYAFLKYRLNFQYKTF